MNAQLHSATATSAAVSHDGWAGYPDVTASQRGDGDGNAFTGGPSAGFAWARKQLTAVTRQSGRAPSDGGRRPENPSVTGKPLLWLRAEGLTLFATALLLYSTTHQPWWLVPAVILLPDLFMVGYVGGSRLGAAVYNMGHSYPLPALMSLAGLAGHHPLVLALGLLWLAHIGMDRLAGFGLKYDSGFQWTHLGGPAGTAGAPAPTRPRKQPPHWSKGSRRSRTRQSDPREQAAGGRFR